MQRQDKSVEQVGPPPRILGSRLTLGLLGASAIAAAAQLPLHASSFDPNSHSTRFSELAQASIELSDSINLAADWRSEGDVRSTTLNEIARATAGAAFNVVLPTQVSVLSLIPAVMDEPTVEPHSKPTSTYKTGTSNAATCSAAPAGTEAGEASSSSLSSSGSSICSTNGLTGPLGPNGTNTGSCSAQGADSRNKPPLFEPTDNAACSTSGSSGAGTTATKTCSIQSTSSTRGGGCSAGSLGENDHRASAKCSVLEGSENGSSCSVTGNSKKASEVDCSAGANHPDKESSCSTEAGASWQSSDTTSGGDSFCSVKANSSGQTKAACSAFDMSHTPGSGKSGDAACSVLGDGEGKCSVQGSHTGGGNPGPGGVDGFCTTAVGNYNTPGSGEANCSVDPAGDGKGAGECSVFNPEGEFVSGPDKDGNCQLPAVAGN